jgi:hypothetical protein
MWLVFLIQALSIALINAATFLDYEFGTNFGAVFYDYSGNGRMGVNGASWLTASTSSTAGTYTDRGLYLSNTQYVTLPPNDYVTTGFHLGSTFTVTTWINTNHIYKSENYIFQRSPGGLIFSIYNPNSSPQTPPYSIKVVIGGTTGQASISSSSLDVSTS